jgi:iron(III) transport system permease protein
VRSRRDFWTLVMLLAFVVLALLLIWPLSSIFIASFVDNATREPTLGNYARVLGQPYFRTALVNSLVVGVGGMAGAMALGLPLAALTARYVIAGRQFVATLAVLALVSPPFIWGSSWSSASSSIRSCSCWPRAASPRSIHRSKRPRKDWAPAPGVAFFA